MRRLECTKKEYEEPSMRDKGAFNMRNNEDRYLFLKENLPEWFDMPERQQQTVYAFLQLRGSVLIQKAGILAKEIRSGTITIPPHLLPR